MLLEKIAQTYWRVAVAAWHEGDAFEKGTPFFQAMNQLERLQRLRKGDDVPAPLNLQVLGDIPGASEEDSADR